MTTTDQTLQQLEAAADRPLRITGPCRIGGEARVQGSKNTANKLVAVTAAIPGVYELTNFPVILDPLQLLHIIEGLGAVVELDPDRGHARIDSRPLANRPLPYDLTKSTTGAFGFAGALLGRFGEVRIGKPGGDRIGPRPVDLHLAAFRALGAQADDGGEEISAALPAAPDGAEFRLAVPSTGAAVNHILAAASSGGRAVLENAPLDSDMAAMYDLLRAAGVRIATEGSTVRIDASRRCQHDDVVRFECAADRNDAFTWLAYGALSQDGLRISNLPHDAVRPGIDVLRQLGVRIDGDGDTVTVRAAVAPPTAPQTIIAGLAGQFHSDWAPLLETALALGPVRTRVIDTLFARRIRQAELLQAMGADVRISGGQAPDGVTLAFDPVATEARYVIDINGAGSDRPVGLRSLRSGVGDDVRACAAIVMAASQAAGSSELSDVRALYRGYEHIVGRLQAVGVDIR